MNLVRACAVKTERCVSAVLIEMQVVSQGIQWTSL